MHAPSEDDLSCGLVVLLCQVLDNLRRQAGIFSSSHAELDIRCCSQVAVRHYLDLLLAAEAVQLLAGVERMDLHLEHGGADLAVLEDLTHHAGADVAAADVSDEAFLD